MTGTDLSAKFYETVQKYLENSIPLERMNFSPVQRSRVEACMEVYRRMVSNPAMDEDKYLRNVLGRTPAEIRKDKKLLAFILSLMDEGTEEISRFRVKKTAEKLIRMGEASGDWKPMEKGMNKLDDIVQRSNKALDIEENTFKLPPIITTDVSKIDANRHTYSPKEVERILRKYGGAKDRIQEMVENKMGMYVPAGTEIPQEEETAAEETSVEEDE